MENTNENARILEAIDEIEKVIIGKRSEIVILLTALLAGYHALVEDVPGTGKTTLASTLAKVTGLEFRRAQFTPDVMASDITGYNIYNRRIEDFEFRSGLVMCNLLLADEINRASPKTQSALLEAMEEGNVTVDGQTYAIKKPFMVIATQNPSGYVGTYPLPEAQLDRFGVRINMGYPTTSEEVDILKTKLHGQKDTNVNNVISLEELNEMTFAVSKVLVNDTVLQYIVDLVSATRKTPDLVLGASPRASVALMKLSQAYAFIKGRDYVTPADVAAIAKFTLSHRLIISQEAKFGGKNIESIINELLRKVAVPYRNNAN